MILMTLKVISAVANLSKCSISFTLENVAYITWDVLTCLKFVIQNTVFIYLAKHREQLGQQI